MRNLNMFLALEVVNGCLNGSSDSVERKISGYDNVSFTKKIGGRSKISGQSIKYNLIDYMVRELGYKAIKKVKDGSIVKSDVNPFGYIQQDVFGYMIPSKQKVTITKEEYDNLKENEKTLWKKESKGYTKTIVEKKRTARLQINAFVNVSNNKIEREQSTVVTSGDNMLYVKEVYSGVHTTIANLDIENIGKFIVTDDKSQFRDYDVTEAEKLEVRDLTNEEKLERINSVLEAIEYFKVSGNQSNYLTDTTPKFVILGDYSWGNNAFGNAILNQNGVNINALKQSIEQNERFRCSNIYIGVKDFFDDKYNTIKEELEEELKDYDFIKISSVHQAFEDYKEELKSNLQ